MVTFSIAQEAVPHGHEAAAAAAEDDQRSYQDKLKDMAVEKYPFLKNAPLLHQYVKRVEGVQVKPVGIALRNIKCIRCGQYGHAAGEKECPLLGKMTTEDVRERERLEREDPFLAIKQQYMADQKLQLTYEEDPIHGGYKKDHWTQQLLPEDDEEEGAGAAAAAKRPKPVEELDETEQLFLQSLSPEEMKILLKKWKKDKKGKTKKKKSKGKSKKKKKRSRSSSSSDSSSSSSDSSSDEPEDDAERRRKSRRSRSSSPRRSRRSCSRDRSRSRSRERRRR